MSSSWDKTNPYSATLETNRVSMESLLLDPQDRPSTPRKIARIACTILAGLVLVIVLIYLLASHHSTQGQIEALQADVKMRGNTNSSSIGPDIKALQERLEQFMAQTETTLGDLSAQIVHLKEQLNASGVESRRYGSEVAEDCLHTTQALNDSISQHLARLEEHILEANETSGGFSAKLLGQCREEIQEAIEPITDQIQGLNITYTSPIRVTQNDTVPSNCSGQKVLYGTQGSVELPSDHYGNNMECGWRVVSPPGTVLAITWLEFHLEANNACSYDWVEVKNPVELEYGRKLCGKPAYLLNNTRIMNGNELEITFHSDGSGTEDGFKMEYQALLVPREL